MRKRYELKSVWKNEAGYNLVEIVVLLFVIGILATIAAASFSGSMARHRLVTSARTMTADLREQRDLAMSKEDHTVVYIYIDENYYQMQKNNGTWENVYLPNTVRFAAYYDQSNTKKCTKMLSFFEQGNSNGGTSRLMNLNGDSKYIRVSPVTGRVYLSENPPG
ncbi:MAG: hypothetical protein AB1500_07125 [Bacillota bacterium]